jgi:L-alanine-DL-glutamate epimerase-like enolase superfamily enzyme
MHAVSYADIALWDIKAKCLGLPLHRLLGGPVQSRIPAYANMVGFSHEEDSVRESVAAIMKAGYRASKWYPQYGPAHGDEGLRALVRLVQTIRDAAGPDMRIMIDAWNSWDVPYTLEAAKRLEEFAVSWIEEPVMPDLVDSYVRLSSDSPVPIAGGEHEYTRWGFRNLLERQAMHVYQPDPAWCGGITEIMKIAALLSAHDVKLAIHGSLTSVTVHVSCTCCPTLVSLVEYLMSISEASQHFLECPTRAEDGHFTPPDAVGAGMDLDEDRIEREREITFN